MVEPEGDIASMPPTINSDSIKPDINELKNDTASIRTELGVKPKKPSIWKRAGNFRDKITAGDKTIEDYYAPGANAKDRKIAEDLQKIEDTVARPEIKASPERVGKVVDEADADALLMRKILASRKGLRGIVSRFDELKIGKFTYGKGVRVLAGNVIAGTLLSAGLHALKLANPIVGGISGGAFGALAGYNRGKNTQESVNRWMTDVGIVGKPRIDLEKMSTADLDIALGVINNAVHEGKVRGGMKELETLMRTYRTMKEIRTERFINSRERDPLRDKIEVEEGVSKLITAQAREQYRELYKEICEGKRKQVWASALKGAVIGASVGSLIGLAISRFSAAGAHGQESHLPGKEPFHLTGQAKIDAGIHQHNLELINQARNHLPPTPPMTHLEQSAQTQLLQQQHPGIFEHSVNIIKQGGRLEGFTHDNLTQFTEHLRAGQSLHSLVPEAGLNNIDLNAASSHGQTLGNFLMGNRDAFLRLTPALQRQVLSYPSVAADILASAATTTGAATAAATGGAASVGVTSAVVGAVGLGVVGFYPEYKLGEKGRKEVNAAYDTAQEAGVGAQKARDEELAAAAKEADDERKAKNREKSAEKKAKETADGEAKKTKFEENMKESTQRIIGQEIRLSDIYWRSRINPAPPDVDLNRRFKVVGVDSKGQIEFAETAEDTLALDSGKNTLPDIFIRELVDKDGLLIKTRVSLVLREGASERRVGNGNEVENFEKMKKESAADPEKYFAAKIIPDGKGNYRGREINKYKIKIGSEPAKPLSFENGALIEAAGLTAGGDCEVKITEVKESDKFKGQVWRLDIALKPKEAPPSKPAVPEPPPAPIVAEPNPEPAPESTEEIAGFKDQGPLDEDEIDDFDSYAEEYGRTALSAAPSEKVVLKTPEGKYRQINAAGGGVYLCRAYNPDTGAIGSSVITFKREDISAGGFSWFLENK